MGAAVDTKTSRLSTIAVRSRWSDPPGFRAPQRPGLRSSPRPVSPDPRVDKGVAVNESRGERIAKAEEDLADMDLADTEPVLVQAKRAVEAADRAERAA